MTTFAPRIASTPFQAFSGFLRYTLAPRGLPQDIVSHDIALQHISNVVSKTCPAVGKITKAIGPFIVLSGIIYHYGKAIYRFFRSDVIPHFASSITMHGDTSTAKAVLSFVADTDDIKKSPTTIELEPDWDELEREQHRYNHIYAYNKTQDDQPSSSRQRPSYVPGVGSRPFRFRGHILYLDKYFLSQRENLHGYGARTAKVRVSCYSLFSTVRVLKDFVEHCQKVAAAKKVSMTSFYVVDSPYSVDGHQQWKKALTQRSRALESVTLEGSKKERLVAGVERFLRPEERDYYINLGIPYRRGYLFYGHPGTGKSSFAIALAGHFNLDIYVLSFSSGRMSEDAVQTLFATLPQRCIALIEDIDSIGVRREAQGNNKQTQPEANGVPQGRQRAQISYPAITLSGLLNAIDGAVAKEGRILIMTTNTPDDLDSALIRPGRVDERVHFGNASKEVVVKLFKRVFSQPSSSNLRHSPQGIATLSTEFAAIVPDLAFTPAEVQGYLLQYRDDPVEAVAAAEDWVKRLRESKENRMIYKIKALMRDVRD
ncbi:MAG: hypothetical protein M1820_009701 [Bogoriella megaspora]|nr:MAG: hypothetical protein M1820_009701 [Bogoriella megaspora]